MLWKTFIMIIFLVLCFPSVAGVFYLPGMAPVKYCQFPHETCQSKVPVFLNTLNSLDSVFTYEYSRLNLCPVADTYATQNFGQTLTGDRIKKSLAYGLKFAKEESCKTACTVVYRHNNHSDIQRLNLLKTVMFHNYQQHMIVDNVPVTWCFDTLNGANYCTSGFPLGCYVTDKGQRKDACVISTQFMKTDTYYVFNHLNIIVTYEKGVGTSSNLTSISEGRILTVTLEPKSLEYSDDIDERSCNDLRQPMSIPGKDMTTDISIKFTYSVMWQKNVNEERRWSNRWDYILENSDSQILFFSAINACIVLLFMVGALFRVRHQKKKTLSKYNETGLRTDWLLVQDDVFRPPSHLMSLTVLVGSGIHICLSAMIVTIFGALGFLYAPNRGALPTTSVICYVVISWLSGFVSARIYKMHGGTQRKLNALLTALMCPGFILTVFLVCNIVHLYNNSSAVVSGWFCAGLILCGYCPAVLLSLIGSYFGLRRQDEVKRDWSKLPPRAIPKLLKNKHPLTVIKACCLSTWSRILLGGALPSDAIFVNLFFILQSMWVQGYYATFHYQLLYFVLMIIQTASIGCLQCYCRLSVENYHWDWLCFLSTATTGLYTFLYCVLYYVAKMEMTGPSSALVYFSYMLLGSAMLTLAAGSVGYLTALWFVRRLYSGLPGVSDEEKEETENAEEKVPLRKIIMTGDIL